MPKPNKSDKDEQAALAKMAAEITTNECESSEALLKIWSSFNDRMLEKQKAENERIKQIKDVKVDNSHVKMLQDGFGLDRREALILLKENQGDVVMAMASYIRSS